ncbi:glycosyltransferase family 87 protein [Actinoplanes sp. NPDC051851]|uniref:glycosyltransferase family 87 protein n=1 Tax=Actinoplanes sp. NPDC051851 TaxID=3154753 RepID=UPI0034413F62
MRTAWRPLALTVALLLAGLQIWQAISPDGAGQDFIPLRHAARALLDGESIYQDPLFVYPPTAAVVLLPTVLGGESTAFTCWIAFQVACMLYAAVLVAREARERDRVPVAAAAIAAMLGGLAATRYLEIGNLTPCLAPVVAGVLIAFRRGEWTVGCALLAASLLVKPLLAPLILLPLVNRAWRPLLTSMVPAAVVLLAGMVAIPGGSRFPEIVRYWVTGTNLHGDNAVNNLTLHGWAEAHGLRQSLATTLAVLIAAAVLFRFLVMKNPGAALLLGTFLCGSLAEASYLPVAVTAVLLTPSRWLIPGLALLAAPSIGVVTPQTQLVAAESLLLTAFFIEQSSWNSIRSISFRA